MAQPGGEVVWLLLGALGTLAGTVGFVWMGRGTTDPGERLLHAVTTLVPAVAFASYLSMGLGVGVESVVLDGTARPVYWARYAEWLFTTPLVLYGLALLAGADRSTVATLVGLDVAAIVAGLLGTLTGGPLSGLGAPRELWWTISLACLLALLWVLFGHLGDQARAHAADGSFTTVRNLVAGLWVAYAVVWTLGTGGPLATPGLVGPYVEAALYVPLDLTAKVGVGVILLRSWTTTERRRDVTTATDTA